MQNKGYNSLLLSQKFYVYKPLMHYSGSRSIFSCTIIASILHIPHALLVTAVHVKMKVGDNTLNNERLLLECNDKTSDKKINEL